MPLPYDSSEPAPPATILMSGARTGPIVGELADMDPAMSLASVGVSPALSAPADARRAGLDLRLAAVLRGAAQGLGCGAAELWLLDDATRRLRLRAAWRADGAPADDASRPLEAAEADLAALAGGAVVLEDAATAREWSLHRRVGAAAGVPVATELTIHGVLWLLADHPRPFSDAQVQLAEIVAGRLAVELERADLLGARGAEALGPTEPASMATELPTEAPSLDGMELAGWTSPTAGVALHDWRRLDDGRLLAFVANVVDSPASAGESALLAAQCARVAARTLASRCRDAGELLDAVSAELWQSSASGEGVAMAALVVDERTGEGSYAAAGPCVVVRSLPGQTDTIACDAPPLGWDPDAAHAPRVVKLAEGERLAIVAGGPRLLSPIVERRLADTLRSLSSEGRRTQSARDTLRRLRSGDDGDLSAAVVLRRC